VGLHPVWLMFSLFAFGALFGFVGMIVAVPVAAAVGRRAAFVVRRYRASEFYLRPPRRRLATGLTRHGEDRNGPGWKGEDGKGEGGRAKTGPGRAPKQLALDLPVEPSFGRDGSCRRPLTKRRSQ